LKERLRLVFQDGDTKARCLRSLLSDLFKLQRSTIMFVEALEKSQVTDKGCHYHPGCNTT
jgi:hypothetical protein